MNLSTIPELAKLNGITTQQVSVLFKANGINPIEKKKVNINGFIGWAYEVSEVESVIRTFVERKNKPKKDFVIKKYTNEEVCLRLRNDVGHYLWNREIKNWNSYDWKEFEKLTLNKLL